MIASKTELTSDAVALHYDELDRFYREIWGEHVHHGLWLTGRESRERAVVQLAELVAREAAIQTGSRVCDVGCGYGATARLLAQDHGAEVTALTISPAQNQFALTKDPASQNPRYLLCDWLKNDLPAESFDAVIAIESSEHMPDKAAFFAQAFRVLRPGGRCVVTAWLAREGASGLENRFVLEPVCREGRMPSMGTESDYRRLFETAGFRFDAFQDLTKQVKNMAHLRLAVLHRPVPQPRVRALPFQQAQAQPHLRAYDAPHLARLQHWHDALRHLHRGQTARVGACKIVVRLSLPSSNFGLRSCAGIETTGAESRFGGINTIRIVRPAADCQTEDG